MRTIHRDIVGPFIFSSDNQVLLGKSRKGGVFYGLWMIPGGGVEPGETKLEALIRETVEEVGIDISEFSIEQIKETTTGASEKVLRDTGERVMVDMVFNNFLVQTNTPASETPIRCNDDIVEAAWFPVEELWKYDIAPSTLDVLRTLGRL